MEWPTVFLICFWVWIFFGRDYSGTDHNDDILFLQEQIDELYEQVFELHDLTDHLHTDDEVLDLTKEVK